ncbi:MAG TPA: tetratricopeptide repeat protein [Acidimicrobiales bacterium]
MSTDVTDATFQSAVIERSSQVPVVVDLWAPWCGPCRTLGPILEDVVDATDGAVELVKINVDENPQVSAAFQVQSIPAVYALVDGKVVDGFLGAQPAPRVQEFVSGLQPSESDKALSSLLAAGDEASLRQALELKPDHHDAIVALAELLATRRGDGDTDEALALLGRIPETTETRRVAALARTGAGATDGESSGDEITAKLDDLLDQVKADDAARQEYVDLLEVLGTDDPRTADYRKRLTARLY